MIEDHKVDLLLLQESYRPEQHLPPYLIQVPPERIVWACATPNKWGSGIYTSSGVLERIPMPGFDGWVVAAELKNAEWQDPERRAVVVSVHAPSGAGGYAGRVNAILDTIRSFTIDVDLIIGGDFNLFVSYWSEPPRATSKKDQRIQSRLDEEFGLINCWQTANPGIEPVQTLRWRDEPETPYHCDGIFVSKHWKERLVKCEVLSDDGWSELSDHNPVIADFGGPL